MNETYDKSDLQQAIETIKNGGLIIYPTDTVWGLGCDATNSKAVERLRLLKGRSAGKGLLILVDSPARIISYTENAPDIAFELIETATEPITLIFDKARNLAPGVAAEDGSIGIRVTKETFSRALCRGLGKPIVSTSANLAGGITPACFSQISDQLKQKVDYVANFQRENESEKMPSHIIKIGEGGLVKIIR